MNNRLQFHGKINYFFRSDVLTVRELVHLPYYNKVKCDENDRLESPFQINAKQ